MKYNQAFPRAGYGYKAEEVDRTVGACPVDGMTLRDYFAAHAPADPQSWFQPAMPDKPKAPGPKPVEFTTYNESKLQVEVSPAAKKWRELQDAYDAWGAEYQRQLCIQWPYAWADAVLSTQEQAPATAAESTPA